MDFADFVLSCVESEVECGNEVSWRVGVERGADRFQ